MIYRKPSNAMWIDAVRLLEQADNLHRQFFRPGPAGPQGPTWEPPIDIFETGRALSVLVALPGVAPDQVQVLIDGATLTVVGERPLPAPAEAHIRRIEFPTAASSGASRCRRAPSKSGSTGWWTAASC